MLKRILSLMLLLPLVSEAQVSLPDTTITLQEIKILARRRSDLSAGHPTHEIDSLSLQHFSAQHLAFLLSRHSGMFIKSYGPGVLATTSLRGGSAGQTALLWNGFSLQSPMHQQSDLALLPVFFMDQIEIQHGGSSAIWGSGAMGGALFLNNKPPAATGLSARAGIMASNLNDLAQHLTLQFGSETIKSSLRVFHNNARNHYQYRNTAIKEAPLEVQQHAGLQQWGLLQENYLNLGRHSLNMRLWLQDNKREIPPTLQQTYNGAFQDDESLRLTLAWQGSFHKLISSWRGAYFRETLLYFDNINSESLSHSNTLIQEAELRWQASPGLMVHSGLILQHVDAIAREYQQKQFQQSISLFSSLVWQPMPGTFHATLNLRQEYIGNMQIPLVPSLGLSWKPLESLSLSANAGKNYRIPSLNDRYWHPGGNPDLLPESGWSQDVTFGWKNLSARNANQAWPQKLSLTLFHRITSNWIIWLPRQGGLWSPDNILEVKAYGAEFRSSGNYQVSAIVLQWNASWDHVVARNTKARSLNDQSLGKQLIYVPLNRAALSFSLFYKNMMWHYTQQLTGRRFTSSDNSVWLEPYHTADLGFSWKGTMGKNSLEFSATAVNLWNQSYLIVAARPMPLRYYQAGVTLHFNTNQQTVKHF